MRIGSTNDCLPPFLQDNIDSVQKMKDCARSNLNELSIEMMSEFIHNKVIPAIVKDKYNVKKNSDTYMDSVKMVLKPYHIQTICPSTVY